MSDLQIGLLAVGAAIVVAVLLFNWNQERRFRKQADAAFHTPVADALMQPAAEPRESHNRVEPALREPVFGADVVNDGVNIQELHLHVDTGSPRVDAPAAPANSPSRPMPPSPAPSTQAPPSRPAVAATSAPYDELIEYRVRLDSDGVAANVFADAVSYARNLGKAVRWAGLPVGASEWEDIQPWRDVRYQQVVVTLQLADRNGAVLEEHRGRFLLAEGQAVDPVVGALGDRREQIRVEGRDLGERNRLVLDADEDGVVAGAAVGRLVGGEQPLDDHLRDAGTRRRGGRGGRLVDERLDDHLRRVGVDRLLDERLDGEVGDALADDRDVVALDGLWRWPYRAREPHSS